METYEAEQLLKRMDAQHAERLRHIDRAYKAAIWLIVAVMSLSVILPIVKFTLEGGCGS